MWCLGGTNPSSSLLQSSSVFHPILDTRISVRVFVRPCVTLRLPPVDSETGWTGEPWSKTNILNWQTKWTAFFSFLFLQKLNKNRQKKEEEKKDILLLLPFKEISLWPAHPILESRGGGLSVTEDWRTDGGGQMEILVSNIGFVIVSNTSAQ